MENSENKSGGVVIPKRQRSLDLKSLYESGYTEVGGSRKNGSGENEQVDVVRKKRKNRKEVSLSSLESDANKRRKCDENGTKSELGLIEKLDSWSRDLHGMSLSLGTNGSSFNIPKRPRGSVGRKVLEGDQGDSEPLRLFDSIDCVGSFKADVTKSEDKGKFVGSNKLSKPNADSKSTGNSSGSGMNLKKVVDGGFVEPVGTFEAEVTPSKNKGNPIDKPIRPVTLSTGNIASGKVVGLNKKSKQKVDPKSTMNSRSPNVKMGAVEVVDCVGEFKAKVTKSENKGIEGKVLGLKKTFKWRLDPKSTMNSSSSNVKLKKKLGADESAKRVGASDAGVSKSEDKGVLPNDLSGRSANKDNGLSKKSKQKADPKSTMNSGGSNAKLKKKMGADEAVDHRGAFGAAIIKSENVGGPNIQSVSPITLSASKGEAGKVVGSSKNSKQRANTKSTMNSNSSNVKSNKKVGADENLGAHVNSSEGKGSNDKSVRSGALSAAINYLGKVVGLNKKSKGKADTPSTLNSSSPNVKLKKKVGPYEAADSVGEFVAEINSSEDKDDPKGQSVRLAALSTGKDEAGKIVGSNKKSKQKADPKSTKNSSSSNVKLKAKIGTDEAVDRVGAFQAEDNGGTNDRSVRMATISASNEARNVVGIKKQSKRKLKPRSTMTTSSSNLKLKVETNEAVEVTKSDEKGGPNDISGKDGFSNPKLSEKIIGSSPKSKRKADPKTSLSPRGSNKKLKVEADEAVLQVAAFREEVTKPGNNGGSVTLSTGKDGISNSRLAGKIVGSSAKYKRKGDGKSTPNPSGSTVKLKQKVIADEVKGKTNGQSDSVPHAVKESSPNVNKGDVPSKKRRSKKKDLVIDGDGVGTSIKKSESAVARPASVSDSPFIDSLDEDDDDLEQNAARMLSSRFDPSCTGFSCKRKPSVSQMVDELCLPVSSEMDSTNRRVKSSGGGEFDSADDNDRELKPRGGDKGKGVMRKRRHFYEIPTQDLDPHWFLKRKIKIFWPLDESWYFGHVTDYHSEAKLHHLKYDDGEEEWVNLEEENFRLLLHRFEIPGKEKPRKQSSVVKDTKHVEKTVPPPDHDNCLGSDPDSEPIASWLASLSQRVKNLSKSSKRQKKSQNHLSMASALPYVKTGNSNDNVSTSKMSGKKSGREPKSAGNRISHGTFDNLPLILQNGNHAVYVRKKHQKKSVGSNSVSRGAKARGSVPWPVTPLSPDMISLPTTVPPMISLPTTNGNMFDYGCVEGYLKQLWSIFDNLLRESKEFEIHIWIPLLPYLEFMCVGSSWMLHDIFMLHHGVIMTTSSAIFLEMLVIDSNNGLKSLLFEGCLMQALAIVFRILTVFGLSDERCNGKLKVPMTSIRFQLSNAHDLRKRHVFEVYCFSKLKRSKWLYLETKILQQCLLIKELSGSECTYGSIKDLECGGILQPCKSLVVSELSAREDLRKKFGEGLIPMGQSDFRLTKKRGNIPRFSLSTLAASNSLLSLQLLLLVEHGSAASILQHEDQLCSPESSGNGGVVLVSDATENTNSSDKLQKDLSGDQQVDMPFARNLNEDFVLKSKTMGPRVSSKRRRSSTISSLLGIGCLSPVSADSHPNFIQDGFSKGPRRPRTQVQYTLPLAGYDVSSKQETSSPRSIPCKRIRRASLKRVSDVNNQKKMELLTSLANVLVTNGDKGWRETGAQIVLESSDHNEWRLAVKLSGVTKFSYKVTHTLQLGSANRYSHAMIWKGGKDWTLEFPDRSQWLVFKEMYEECCNRNIRAASVRNIPIPGVRPVLEGDDYDEEAPFVRNSTMYFRQVQTDAEMAMDPSRILYDMDSDDEQWLVTHKDCNGENMCEEISDEFFEVAMDMFEKVSYGQRRENLTDAEIEEVAIVIGSAKAAKQIYLHWRKKREKMCMPLIRHLQPPPWQRYQKQMKEWEQSISRSVVERVNPLPEKPPMFAFCFKPRGLDVPNKPSKQRSHRRLSVSRLHSGEHGRRPNRNVYRDEKSLYDVSLRPSTRDANFNQNNRSSSNGQKNNRKKVGPTQRQPEIDVEEYRAREALGVSRDAREMARLKRDRAERIFCKADEAMHKALTVLMQAEAMKDDSLEEEL